VLQRAGDQSAGGALTDLDLFDSFCIKAKRTESQKKKETHARKVSCLPLSN
jgi:hypothetical protein